MRLTASLILSLLLGLASLAQDPMVPHDPSIDVASAGSAIEGTFDVVLESTWLDLGSMTIAPSEDAGEAPYTVLSSPLGAGVLEVDPLDPDAYVGVFATATLPIALEDAVGLWRADLGGGQFALLLPTDQEVTARPGIDLVTQLVRRRWTGQPYGVGVGCGLSGLEEGKEVEFLGFFTYKVCFGYRILPPHPLAGYEGTSCAPNTDPKRSDANGGIGANEDQREQGAGWIIPDGNNTYVLSRSPGASDMLGSGYSGGTAAGGGAAFIHMPPGGQPGQAQRLVDAWANLHQIPIEILWVRNRMVAVVYVLVDDEVVGAVEIAIEFTVHSSNGFQPVAGQESTITVGTFDPNVNALQPDHQTALTLYENGIFSGAMALTPQ